MFRGLIRLLYSLSYFTPLLILLEAINVTEGWNDLGFYWNPDLLEGLRTFGCVHYPALLFLLVLLSCKQILKKGSSMLSRKQLDVHKSNEIGWKEFSFIIQFFPLLMQQSTSFSSVTSWVIFLLGIVVLLAFFTSFGAFNPSLYFLRYYQYRVSTDNLDYWLISKRKIRDLPQSFCVVEISNGIMLRV